MKVQEILNDKKNNTHLVIGELYDIATKKGIVKKYLSYIDEKTITLYFVTSKNKVNSSNLGYMFGCRGTAHRSDRIIGLSNET